MKRLLLSTLFLFFAVAAFAQKGAVSGTVLDADTGESVAGAVLEVAPVKTPDQKQYFTSGYKGAVAIPSLPYDEYRLTVSFLGYNNYETIIGKTKCDGIQNQMRLFGGRVSPKRKATKISHTHTKKHRSNGF